MVLKSKIVKRSNVHNGTYDVAQQNLCSRCTAVWKMKSILHIYTYRYRLALQIASIYGCITVSSVTDEFLWCASSVGYLCRMYKIHSIEQQIVCDSVCCYGYIRSSFVFVISFFSLVVVVFVVFLSLVRSVLSFNMLCLLHTLYNLLVAQRSVIGLQPAQRYQSCLKRRISQTEISTRKS